ncbi:4-amino-4-deoxychorismate lyase [Paenibacillus taihuensis]|uniref:4-amino-4-deoxychorismate lyase n=1 Tax=Paenibacillus taihuensis TaxID=1156355 RepID=A0A3D9Q3Q5_9BACL|nr:aminotransferase class IV [Paenibacillus taihuensis]REE56406.1 4-amino-4-deoxychorismate lyase [Paenibacillus taihuensis]
MNIGWNGSIIRQEEAVISVYDHGFLYGMGLFETFRTYGGKPYLLQRHLDRLAEGCAALGIRGGSELSADKLTAWLHQLMEANQLTDAYVRLTVTAGEDILGLPSGDYEKPNMLLMVKSLPAPNPSLYQNGRELALLKTVRNTPESEVRLKSLHYMNNIIAKRELAGSGAAAGAEGLMLTKEGYLAEGIVSNLFFVRGGHLYTPAIETGILPGITRGRVLELARESAADTGIAAAKVEEGLYTWVELMEADEVFITNSIQELVPVTSLRDLAGDCRTIGNGQAGPITTKLLDAYQKDTR